MTHAWYKRGMDTLFATGIGMFWINLGGALVCLVVGVVMATTARRTDAVPQAHRLSVRARLPFGSAQVHERVRARLARSQRAHGVGLIAVSAVISAFLPTPLGDSTALVWFVFIPAMFLMIAVGDAWSQLRESLFAPAPDRTRVARTRPPEVADYVGPTLRRLPGVLLVLAAVGTAIAGLAPAAHRSSPLLWASVPALALGVAAVVFLPAIERRVLDRGQHAGDALELAWDDLFRTDALRASRFAQLLILVVAAGLAVLAAAAAWLDGAAVGLLASFLPLTVSLCQVAQALTQGRLPFALHPESAGASA